MRDLASLPAEDRERAAARYQLLVPYLEAGRTLRSVAESAGISLRTAQRWVSRYRRFGLVALARQERSDDGQRRAVSSRLQRVIEGLALEKPPLPISAIYRQIKNLATCLGETAPSYPVVHRIARNLPQSLLMLAHEGSKAYSEKFDLVHRREASGPNSIWQVDHCLLDIPILREDGSTLKPWLTIVIDDYSRAVAGYYIAFDPPSTLRTALALRQGIWRKDDPRWPVCGIPEVLYTDNGSDFTSQHMEQVAIDLKIRLVFSIPGKPRGRGRIERFFRTVNQMFLSSVDGYLARSRKKLALTLPMLDEQFRAFLLDEYHRRPGPENEACPIERWEAGGFLPRMPESLDQLDLLLIQAVRSRKVRPDGIHFEGLRFLSSTLAAYVGEEVTLRYDPRDMGEIRVFYKDEFLCRAIAADLAGEVVSLKEILRARNHRRKELRTFISDRRQAVDALIELKRGSIMEANDAKPTAVDPSSTRPKLKRYRNE